jgi:hypothetical protein
MTWPFASANARLRSSGRSVVGGAPTNRAWGNAPASSMSPAGVSARATISSTSSRAHWDAAEARPVSNRWRSPVDATTIVRDGEGGSMPSRTASAAPGGVRRRPRHGSPRATRRPEYTWHRHRACGGDSRFSIDVARLQQSSTRTEHPRGGGRPPVSRHGNTYESASASRSNPCFSMKRYSVVRSMCARRAAFEKFPAARAMSRDM